MKRIVLFAGFLFLLVPFAAMAENEATVDKTFLFLGKANSDNINVRTDSTTSAKVICTVAKGQRVQVVKESYEWYKIRLPKSASSFIKKDFVELIDEKTAKVIKDNVNIRLGPNEQSAILGRAGNNEIINIRGESGEWYEIEPLSDNYGWINKRFVDKTTAAEIKEVAGKTPAEEESLSEEEITVEGIIRPYGKVFKRLASHKLIATNNKVFLLKGNKENLDSLNYRKVKITGKLLHPKGKRDTLIEIEKIEALD